MEQNLPITLFTLTCIKNNLSFDTFMKLYREKYTEPITIDETKYNHLMHDIHIYMERS